MRLVTFVRVIPPAPEIYRRNLSIIYHVCAQIRPSIYISDFEHRTSDIGHPTLLRYISIDCILQLTHHDMHYRIPSDPSQEQVSNRLWNHQWCHPSNETQTHSSQSWMRVFYYQIFETSSVIIMWLRLSTYAFIASVIVILVGLYWWWVTGLLFFGNFDSLGICC